MGREMAEKWQVPVFGIQHHKAHFASVLAEHNLFDSQNPVLGVIWDGTGLGDDDMIWGGEFFTFRDHQMERVAHFEYFDSLAGDKMAKEPRLSLFSLNDKETEIEHKFSSSELKIYRRLKENSTLLTSSVGRLFDAVASLLDVLNISSYEGEAAMLLEDLAWRYQGNDLIDLLEGVSFENIPSRQIIKALISLKRNGVSDSKLAASFIHTLGKVIIKTAKEFEMKTVACSGGVFQNRFLVREVMQLARENEIELLLHKELSSNDENIALGQLAYYQHINE